MNKKSIRVMGTLIAAAMLTAITSANAASYYWTNNAGGSATAGANWSSGVAPGAGDFAFFTNNTSYTITSFNWFPDAIYFNANSGTVTNAISAGGVTQPLGGGFNIGDSVGSTATVVQVGGQIYTYQFYVGNNGQGSFAASGAGTIVSAVAGLGVAMGVGTGSSGNFFMLTNGAYGNQTAGGYIGFGTNSNYNTAIVTGAGTSWTNSGSMFLGYNNGSFNTVRIENGGTLAEAYSTYVGYGTGSSNNTMILTGTNTAWGTWFIPGGPLLYVGYGANSANNTLAISNGAVMRYDGSYFIEGAAAGANGNRTIVSGPGSAMVATNGANFYVGYLSANNSVLIDNGGQWLSGAAAGIAYIGDASAAASNNTVTVTGSNSLLKLNANDFRLGNQGGNNSLIVSNGAKVQLDGGSSYQLVGTFTSSDNNLLKVSGPGSSLYWTNTTFHTAIGYQGPNNRLVIENGGQMFSFASSGASRLMVGEYSTSSGNAITVTGSNSLWKINVNPADTVSEFTFGNASSGNSMVISNGGKVQFDGRYFEIANSTANNSVTVTGAGSVFSNVNANFYVGYNGSNNRLVIDQGGQFYGSNMIVNTGSGGNGIRILNGGLLDANILSVSSVNTVTNLGGIFQFSSATPTITASGANIVLTNGMISFRNIGNAPISPVSGITYQGVNDYQLNSASNASVASYTFDTGLGASNYRKLQLVGANPTWQGTALTIGSGGLLVVSNATAAGVTATVTNAGTITVDHSTVTWSGKVLINGKYISDPSTNTFLADVTVGQSGTLAGGAGDLFDFKKSLYINATNNIGFQLANSAVMFSGGGMHTNAITGQDLGHDAAAFNAAYVTQTNFAYGELHLGSAADQVCFTCGNIPTIASNGLYVGWLDLLGSASLVTNLHAASGINIYYNLDDTRNSYLNGASYQLTDCNFGANGGFLMGIPEPSALILFGAAAGLLLRRRSKRL